MTEIEQIDRDAAKALWSAEGVGPSMPECWPEAFARHRIQSRAAGSPPFAVGSKVFKLRGHSFGNGSAEVVACYRTKAGAWRVVVEHPEGWQFIFAPEQLAAEEAEA